MFQNPPGRPRKREKDAEDALRILKGADWGMGHREIASKLRRRRPAASIYRALLLLAGIMPLYYAEELDLEDISRVEIRNARGAREGIVRWDNSLGGWYWWENEERFGQKADQDRRVRALRRMATTQREDAVALMVKRYAEKAAANVRFVTQNRFVRWLARRTPESQSFLRGLDADPEAAFRPFTLLAGIGKGKDVERAWRIFDRWRRKPEG